MFSRFSWPRILLLYWPCRWMSCLFFLNVGQRQTEDKCKDINLCCTAFVCFGISMILGTALCHFRFIYISAHVKLGDAPEDCKGFCKRESAKRCDMAFEAWDISFLEHKQTKHYPCDWNQHQIITDGYVSSDIYLENTLALKIFTYLLCVFLKSQKTVYWTCSLLWRFGALWWSIGLNSIL